MTLKFYIGLCTTQMLRNCCSVGEHFSRLPVTSPVTAPVLTSPVLRAVPAVAPPVATVLAVATLTLIPALFPVTIPAVTIPASPAVIVHLAGPVTLIAPIVVTPSTIIVIAITVAAPVTVTFIIIISVALVPIIIIVIPIMIRASLWRRPRLLARLLFLGLLCLDLLDFLFFFLFLFGGQLGFVDVIILTVTVSTSIVVHFVVVPTCPFARILQSSCSHYLQRERKKTCSISFSVGDICGGGWWQVSGGWHPWGWRDKSEGVWRISGEIEQDLVVESEPMRVPMQRKTNAHSLKWHWKEFVNSLLYSECPSCIDDFTHLHDKYEEQRDKDDVELHAADDGVVDRLAAVKVEMHEGCPDHSEYCVVNSDGQQRRLRPRRCVPRARNKTFRDFT